MSSNSKIEWTDATWNPTTGCTPVSPGCLNCYAARDARRLGGNPNEAVASKYRGLTVLRDWRVVFNGTVLTHEDRLEIPLRWRNPRMIFVDSQSDLFHESVPFAFIDRVFAVMALCQQHKFQILTKRPERMAEYLCDRKSLPNVWLGTSCENQEAADERIPHLLRCPAAVRFLSCEPLLGPIYLYAVGKPRRDVLRGWIEAHDDYPEGANTSRIDWVIVGGESGPNARPCNVDLIRSIVAQCKAAGVPCFVKQLGSLALWDGCGLVENDPPRHGHYDARFHRKKGGDWNEWPEDLRVREWPKCLHRETP